jgi:hypothetical protein
MQPYKNLKGQKVGHLTVLELSENKFDSNGTTKLWKCQCDCGNIIYKSARHLNEAKKKNMDIACGCRSWDDLSGKKFGDLTAIKLIIDKNGRKKWECKCKCGDILYRSTQYIKKFPYKCIREIMENTAYRNKIKQIVWRMKSRCYDPSNQSYKNYGGRGIKVCDEWLNDSNAFVDWALENGYEKGLEIDRIDYNGDYCPENCRFADDYVQANNKRNNILVTYNGETKSLRRWCRELGLPYRKTHKRYTMYGWEVDRCFDEKERIGFM